MQVEEKVYLGHQDGPLRLMAFVEVEHVSKRKLTDDITAASSRSQYTFCQAQLFCLIKVASGGCRLPSGSKGVICEAQNSTQHFTAMQDFQPNMPSRHMEDGRYDF